MAVDYTKSAAESIAQYNERIKSSQTDTSGGDDFMSTLQKSLLDNQAVSSQDTGIEKMIDESLARTKASGDAGSQRIESAFERQKNYVSQAQERTRTSTLETGRGNIVGVHALKQMDELDRREIADLESRKQEAILSSDIATRDSINGLIMKKYEFRNQAQQQVFSNLLAIGSFGVQAGNLRLQGKQEERLAATQSFAEKSAINSIALKYGLAVSENDTLDTITTKAMPFASQEQQLEIQKTKAEINRANAEAAKALKGEAVKMDAMTAMATAQAINDAIEAGDMATANFYISSVEKSAGLSGLAMVNGAKRTLVSDKYSKENLAKDISENYAQGDSEGAIIDWVNTNALMSEAQRAEARKLASELAPKSSASTRSLFGDLAGVGEGIISGEKALLKYITGY